MSTQCLNAKTLCKAIKKGKNQFNAEDKEHLSECELCRKRLVDLLMRFAAYADNRILDDTHLEPVPEPIMQKMRNSAHQWCSNKRHP